MPFGLSAFTSGIIQSKSQDRSRAMAQGQFDAQMDTSIQRRVADARKAGIHPLFALGASSGASPTAHIGGGGSGANQFGDALGDLVEGLSGLTKRKTEASIGLDEAMANYYNSQASVDRTNAMSRGRDGATVYPEGQAPTGGQVVFGPPEYYNPLQATAKRRGVSSGLHPALTDYHFPDGRTVTSYASDLEADELKQIDILYQRAIHKGSDAIEWFMDKVNQYTKGKPIFRIRKNRRK